MVFQKIEYLHGSIYLDGYNFLHLALEVRTFLDNLHLRWIPVQSPALESLDLPVITAIDIVERKRGITCRSTSKA
jgi:hypothetical protein